MERIIREILFILKKLDIFGVPFQLSVQGNNKFYKSPLGGILAFLIYFITALYSIWLIYKWISWQIPPQVNSQNKPTPGGHSLQLTQTLFEFSFIADGLSRERYKHLKENGFFLYDHSVHVSKYDEPKGYTQHYSGNSSKCNQQHNISYFSAGICQNIDNPKENYLYQDERANQDTYLYYSINYCDPSTNKKCVGKNEILEGADRNWMYWELILFREEVDLSNGEVYRIPSILNIQFNNDTKNYQYIQLKITKADVTLDNGFMFSNTKKFSIVKDIQAYITTEMSDNLSRGPTIVVSLEKYVVDIRISFPSMTIIISQISSCFQILVIFGIFITQLNSLQMQNQLNQRLLEVYFPQFKDINIIESYFGRVKQVTYQNAILSQQVQKDILTNRSQIIDVLQSRLDLINIIHDITQLQMQLNQFNSSHQTKQFILTSLSEKQENGLSEEIFYKHFSDQNKQTSEQCSSDTKDVSFQDPIEILPLQQQNNDSVHNQKQELN